MVAVMKTEAAQGSSPASVRSPVLAVSDLVKTYRSRRRGLVNAVDGVSFEVAPGEVLGLLGPNGAGKTTTIKCMCTLIRPDSGSILVKGVDGIANPRKAVSYMAAVLEGNRNIYWRLTVRENLQFFSAVHGIPPKRNTSRIDSLIQAFRLEEVRNSDARTLSRGMQQKLAVACAFVKGTPLLMLDEPTLGLDVETSFELRAMLKEMVAESGQTILLSSHDMDVVQELCERVIIINNGRIVTDDKVSNLLELFKARAYRLTLSGPVPEALGRELEATFENIQMTSDSHHSAIDVELLDGGRFYDLVDLLRKFDAEIDSIDRADPDLGEVFLRIVRGEAR